MQKFGFIGLGNMGSAMAANLIKAGFAVTIWNRSADKCIELTKLGARIAGTPREVVEACDITFAMLADPAAAQYVCFGLHGVLEAITPGKGYVDMSTVDPGTSQKSARRSPPRGDVFWRRRSPAAESRPRKGA